MAIAPFLVRRFVQPAVSARALTVMYLALMVGVMLGVVGILVFLVLFLAPHWLMDALRIGCVHGNYCLHALPPSAQFLVWMLAAVLLGWLLWRITRITVSTARASKRVRSAALACGWIKGWLGPFPVCETDEKGVTAFTVGIIHPVIVISSGLRESLAPGEYQVVLAHEQAHAAARDNLSLLLGRVVAHALFLFPGIGAAHNGLRRSVEIAADAFAGRQTGDRLLVASSLNRVASLAFESARPGRSYVQPGVASFGHEELVVERIHHLVFDEGHRSTSRLLCAMAMVILALSVLGTSVYAVAGHNIAGKSQATACVDTARNSQVDN